ncbi:MAG TPA: hypothetical protein VKT80_13465, partial [Chloroflexota bacterium]|nr:hypothetical protein [Chloroflexota bacterium]
MSVDHAVSVDLFFSVIVARRTDPNNSGGGKVGGAAPVHLPINDDRPVIANEGGVAAAIDLAFNMDVSVFGMIDCFPAVD